MAWLALALTALVALAGCAERPDQAGPATLVFKHAKIFGPTDPIPGLLREFERAHPGVTVRSEPLTWTSDEQHQFYVINLEGASPTFDVLMLDVIWVPEFAQAGWLLDLSRWVSRAELTPHFPAAAAAASWRGRVWGLPWNMNVGVLYYRADLLAKYRLAPPQTWEQLVEQARRIRAGFAGVEEGQQLASGLEQRPQSPYDRLDQAFIHVVREVPAEHDIKLSVGKVKVFVEEFFAVEDFVALLVFRDQFWVGRGFQQIFAIDFVSSLGKVADIGGRCIPEIKNAERLLGSHELCQFAQSAGPTRQPRRRLIRHGSGRTRRTAEESHVSDTRMLQIHYAASF